MPTGVCGVQILLGTLSIKGKGSNSANKKENEKAANETCEIDESNEPLTELSGGKV